MYPTTISAGLRLCQCFLFVLILIELVVFSLLQQDLGKPVASELALGLESFKTRAITSRFANSTFKEKLDNPIVSREEVKDPVYSEAAVERQPMKEIHGTHNIWESSTILPQWMKDYFTWHKEQRSKLNQTNWQDFRFIVMRCLATDSRCGGTADRIKTVPLIIHWAAKSKRILLIYWSRPAHLEEFLLPPEGGIDWTIPEWLVDHVVHGTFAAEVNAYEHKISNKHLDMLVSVRTKVQSYNGGAIFYNLTAEGPPFAEVYHDVWRTLFTPSLPVQEIIRDQLKRFNIQPGNYVAAHLRGLYAVKDRKRMQIVDMAENALNCATNLLPAGPIYFASDSKEAVDFVADEFAPQHNSIKIVTLQRDYEPLHLEKAKNWENRTASEYYDTFVDLYLIALSRCVTYNVGGFGQWGLWIAGTNCSKTHGEHKRTLRCEWSGEETPHAPLSDRDDALFLPPMKKKQKEVDESTPGWGNHEDGGDDVGGDLNDNDYHQSKDSDGVHNAKNLWDSSHKIPSWMKAYFEWHRVTKSNLTEENWNATKYIVMQCRAADERCGGLSDRIRPMPLMLMLAARSRRLLLIQWSRPFPLEEFLVPPLGGMNWTLPTWLGPRVETQGYLSNSLDGTLRSLKKNGIVVRTRYQSNNHGSGFYNEQNETVSFEEVYHDMFHVLFQPSPGVAAEIESNMRSLGLVPGGYSAAHLRAFYGRNSRPENITKTVAVNAINCASEFQPGGPVYFASDSKLAVDYIKEYASNRSLAVVSVEHEQEPLHLDKASNWTTRRPAEYYALFVDLFLLGQSRCIAYSNGGFGTFGLLLSYNYSCSVRYFAKRILKNCPKWID